MPHKDPEQARAYRRRRYKENSQVREMNALKNRQYRSNPENREKLKKWREKYRASNAGKMMTRKHLLAKYNLTFETYDSLLKQQSGVCLFCSEPPDQGINMDIEHDHTCCNGAYSCGKCIRGIVHHGCNGIIAIIENQMGRFESYITRSRQIQKQSISMAKTH